MMMTLLLRGSEDERLEERISAWLWHFDFDGEICVFGQDWICTLFVRVRRWKIMVAERAFALCCR